MKGSRPELPQELKPGSAPRPTFLRILRVWLLLSLQSFGGGTATFTLARRAAVESERWLTEEEFNRCWALCQIAPGINLLALTILIGRRAAGWAGIAAALIGLLAPSVAITILMSAFYAGARQAPAMRAALRGVLPATIGLGAATCLSMVRAEIRAIRGQGAAALGVGAAILVGSAIVFRTGRAPVFLVLLGAGGVGALAGWLRARLSPPAGGSERAEP